MPNLLRKPKATISYSDVLTGLRHVRAVFRDKDIHVFGVGGTATLHLAALCGFDSADSCGWRNRAARGIIQFPGSGERFIADLGNWRGAHHPLPSGKPCAIAIVRLAESTVSRVLRHELHGFCCRATHNLWVLLEENRWLNEQIAAGTYAGAYAKRVDNSTYKPIIEKLLDLIKLDENVNSTRP